MLGRPVTPAELQVQVSALNRGLSRSALVASLLGSAEYRRYQNYLAAAGLYKDLLGRAGSSAEIAAAMNQLTAGTAYEALEVALVFGADYYARAQQAH